MTLLSHTCESWHWPCDKTWAVIINNTTTLWVSFQQTLMWIFKIKATVSSPPAPSSEYSSVTWWEGNSKLVLRLQSLIIPTHLHYNGHMTSVWCRRSGFMISVAQYLVRVPCLTITLLLMAITLLWLSPIFYVSLRWQSILKLYNSLLLWS